MRRNPFRALAQEGPGPAREQELAPGGARRVLSKGTARNPRRGRSWRSWKTVVVVVLLVVPCILWVIMAGSFVFFGDRNAEMGHGRPLVRDVGTAMAVPTDNVDPCADELLVKLGNRQKLAAVMKSEACPKLRMWDEDVLADRKGRFLVVIIASPSALWQLEHWVGYSWLDVGIIVNPVRYPDVQVPKRALALSRWIFNDSLSKNSAGVGSPEEKWIAIAHALQMRVWRSYEFVWMPDAQVRLHPTQVRRMLQISSTLGVMVGYPRRGRVLQTDAESSQWDDVPSVSLNRSESVLHYEERLNLEAPFVRGDLLQLIRQFFSQPRILAGRCAMEILFPLFLGSGQPKVAVLDSTPYTSLALAGVKPGYQPRCVEAPQSQTESLSLGEYFKLRSTDTDKTSWCYAPSADALALARSSPERLAEASMSPERETLILDPTIEPSWFSPAALKKVRWKTLILLIIKDFASARQTILNMKAWAGYETLDIVVMCNEDAEDAAESCMTAREHADIYLPGAHTLMAQMSKFELTRWMLARVAGWKNEYEFVWLPDADIRMSALEVQNLVNVATRFALRIAHPAWAGPISAESFAADHDGAGVKSAKTRASKGSKQAATASRNGRSPIEHVHPDYAVRLVSRVSMNAPLIRVDALTYVLPTLRGRGGYLSSLWPQLLRKSPLGIIDFAPYRQNGLGLSDEAARIEEASKPVPDWVAGFDCPVKIPLEETEAWTAFKYHMEVRKRGDVDWCIGLGHNRWLTDLLSPKRNYTQHPVYSIGWEKEALANLFVDPTLPPLWYGPARLNPLVGRNLIIVVAGDNSLHQSWGQNPHFDLCVVYFGQDYQKFRQYKAGATYAFQKKDMKWQLIRHALLNVPWREYEYIWLPDDDVDMDPRKVEIMFRLAHAYSLRLGQPAIYDFGVHYMDHVVRGSWALHYINFIEIMAPFLRVDALEYLFPLWNVDNVYSGYGLDTIWPQLLRTTNIGVIDATPFNHTGGRQIGGRNDTFYSRLKIDAGVEEQTTVRPFDCKMLWNVTKISNYVTVAAHNRNFPEMKLTKQIIVPSRVNKRIKALTAFNMANKYRTGPESQSQPRKFTIIRPMQTKKT